MLRKTCEEERAMAEYFAVVIGMRWVADGYLRAPSLILPNSSSRKGTCRREEIARLSLIL